VLGDIAQGTTPWAATSWPTLLSHLGKPAASVRELDVGYRVPRQILDFASRLLPSIAPDLSPAKSLRADPNALALVPVPPGELGERVAEGCVAALAGLGSVAVICADADVLATAQALRSAGLAFTVLGSDGGVLGAGGSVPGSGGSVPDLGGSVPGSGSGVPDLGSGVPDSDRPGQSEMSGAGAPDISDISDISQTGDRLTLVPVTLAKGLEFDHVVLVEPGQIATGEAYGLRRLYVALTRAVSRLTVFHAEPLPAELSLHTIRAAFELGPCRGRRPPRASQPGVRVLQFCVVSEKFLRLGQN
jgi:hypothetical protein